MRESASSDLLLLPVLTELQAINCQFPLITCGQLAEKNRKSGSHDRCIQIDVRVALLKNVSMDAEQSFRDYKKFRADSKIVGIAEAPQEQ